MPTFPRLSLNSLPRLESNCLLASPSSSTSRPPPRGVGEVALAFMPTDVVFPKDCFKTPPIEEGCIGVGCIEEEGDDSGLSVDTPGLGLGLEPGLGPGLELVPAASTCHSKYANAFFRSGVVRVL